MNLRFLSRAILLLIATCTILTSVVYAQEASEHRLQRLEVSPTFGVLFLKRFSLPPQPTQMQFGGRFTYNITDSIAVESEAWFLPEDQDLHEKRFEAVFGMKLGHRADRVGIFGKVRPGLMRLSEPTGCPIPEGCGPGVPGGTRTGTTTHTEFLVEVGGVIEFYPSSRTVLRLDIDDTVIRFPYYNTSHSRHVIVGIGYRF